MLLLVGHQPAEAMFQMTLARLRAPVHPQQSHALRVRTRILWARHGQKKARRSYGSWLVQLGACWLVLLGAG
eukprot:7592544-Alexandrium_andersonii.AAC.1